MKKNILSILILLMLFPVITGCANRGSDSVSRDFSVDKIEVTYVKSPLNIPSIVEKEKALFAQTFDKYGLPVEYSNLTAGPDQTQALASGDIQFLNAVGATSVILSASNGADIKIISMYSRSPKAFTLFVNNPELTSASDLKGKKVAGPKGTILHELLVAYLATAGLNQSDIQFLSMGIPEAQAALAGGHVDAALLAGPVAYNTAKDGFTALTTGEGLVDATIVVATSNDFYQKNPQLVAAFLEAQRNVLDYMENNPAEIMDIAAKETGLPLEAVKEMAQLYDFDRTITPGDIASMKKTVQFMKETGMIENDVDVNDLILEVD